MIPLDESAPASSPPAEAHSAAPLQKDVVIHCSNRRGLRESPLSAVPAALALELLCSAILAYVLCVVGTLGGAL